MIVKMTSLADVLNEMEARTAVKLFEQDISEAQGKIQKLNAMIEAAGQDFDLDSGKYV